MDTLITALATLISALITAAATVYSVKYTKGDPNVTTPPSRILAYANSLRFVGLALFVAFGTYLVWGSENAAMLQEWFRESLWHRDARHHYDEGRRLYLHFTSSSLDSAETHFKAALNSRGRYAKAFAGLGEVYAAQALLENQDKKRQFLLDDALQNSIEAVTLEPNLLESQRSLSASLGVRGLALPASQSGEKALILDSTDLETRFWKWQAEGREIGHPFVRQLEEDTETTFILGLTRVAWRLALAGETDRARALFQRAEGVARQQGNRIPLVIAGIGYSHMIDASRHSQRRNEEIDEAISYYQDALREDESFLLAHSNLGDAFMARANPGDVERAIQHFDKAIEKEPGYQMAYYNKALAAFELKKDDIATWTWRRAELVVSQSAPDKTQALGSFARALRFSVRGGERNVATEAYDEAVRAGHAARPALHFDRPAQCLAEQLVGPRSHALLLRLMRETGTQAH